MPANQSTPEVTRTDREAAAALRRRASDGQECWLRAADNMEAGHADGSYFVQAFARHRLASATPARGGDELREKTFAGYRLQGPDGEDYFNDTATPLSDNDRRNGWVETPLYALASTDMAGATETLSQRQAREVMNPGSGSAAQTGPSPQSYGLSAAPPVEGLTSGEGERAREVARMREIATDWRRPAMRQIEGPNDLKIYGGTIADDIDRWADMLASSPKATATASVREPWPGYTANMERRRVVTLAKVGQMLSIMAGGEAAEVEGYDAGDLYAEVLMSLGVEDAEFPDLALQGVEDDPEVYFLTDSGTAATIGGERA